jgi:hypothetical protein
MDRVHHELERGVDDSPSFFRVEIRHQLDGAFDVGEEGGDGLPLAFLSTPRLHRCLLGEDALREMLGCVGDG